MKNKNATIILIIILSIIVVITTIFFIGLLTKRTISSNFVIRTKQSNNLTIDEVYDGIYSEIRIDSKAADINILKSSNNQINIKVYEENKDTQITSENNTLTVSSQNESCKGFCTNKKINKIEIYIPSNYENKLNINSKLGDIFVSNFESMNLTIESESGDMNIDSINKANIVSKFGDIEIGSCNNVTIKEDSGDVKVNFADIVDINNNFGDIELGRINHSFLLKSNNGDIEIDSIDLKENSSIKSNYGDVEIGKTNQIKIEAKTNLGNTRIRNNYSDSILRLTIESDYGDIEIEN